MSQTIDKVADQLQADLATRRSLQLMTAKMSEKARKIIIWTYDDQTIKAMYDALRIQDHTSEDKTRRQVIKFPNVYVYHFLNDTFINKYGKDWLKNTKKLKKVMMKESSLLMPWVIGKL